MATLIVPGVNVKAYFDVLPPQPAPSGIVGIAGVVDRPPASGKLVGVTKISELRDLLGPGSLYSLKQGVDALSNGASELVISAVSGGGPASLSLFNVDSEPCVLLKCRFNRSWGTSLAAEVRTILDANGAVVRVNLDVLVNGKIEETFTDLRVAPGEADDLFNTVNNASKLLVALDAGFEDDLPTAGTYSFDASGNPINVAVKDGVKTLLKLLVAEDADPNGLKVAIELPATPANTVKIKIFKGSALQEEFSELVMNPDNDKYLPYVLLTQSKLIRVTPESSFATGKALPVATNGPRTFNDGTSPSVSAFKTAIDLLCEDTRIDLVCAAIEPSRSDADVATIHQALLSHAVSMSDNGAPRIAFGSITAAEAANVDKIKDHASAVRNRRFVLVAPPQTEGLLAGMVGRMDVQESPTFKTISLQGMAAASYRESELNRLLGSTINLCVIQERAGRGIVVLKGINTIGDQISVTRVADKAIRETKAIAENFIGILNSEEARIALKQQLVATFLRMEREGAIVPSTDGKDPAFIVDVYSTQQDFAQGIVRIDIAVRPVRAIDYIYATIRVKN
ncbi:MAG: Phage tail sheath protein [Syntrophus sp. PtaB.Bin001]|nr:MAG: Phage tail sheath protein [Syntrophus sp. PtaB.Bin001]